MSIGSVDSEAALAAFVQKQVELSRVAVVARQDQTPLGPIGEFSAHRAAAASLTSGSVVIFDAEDRDVSGWYDPATGRFTPKVAGPYDFRWNVTAGGALTADNWWLSEMFLNGVALHEGQIIFQRAAVGLRSTGSAQVQMNGSTDFVDVRILHNQGVAVALSATAPSTFFQGHLIAAS